MYETSCSKCFVGLYCFVIFCFLLRQKTEAFLKLRILLLLPPKLAKQTLTTVGYSIIFLKQLYPFLDIFPIYNNFVFLLEYLVEFDREQGLTNYLFDLI